MSGLYNMLFGVSSVTPILLKIVDVDPGSIPRFRDCYIDGDYIVIHTRAGAETEKIMKKISIIYNLM